MIDGDLSGRLKDRLAMRKGRITYSQGHVSGTDEGDDVLTAEVFVVWPMPEDLREELRDRLSQIAGTPVRLVFREEPAMLGGVKVRIGDMVIDDSVAGRLRRLKDFLHATVHNG